jgi:FkbM family methyltransferase
MTLRQLIRDAVVALLPRRSRLAYRVATKVVNLYNNDNEFDSDLNGEYGLARCVLPHCRVAFDVGANVGEWTAAALAINPSLEIHAFEPSPTTVSRLSGRAFPRDVIINPFALGEQNETRDLFIFDDGSEGNSLYRRAGAPSEQKKREVVAVRALDEYRAANGVNRVDFLKIDTEGHELAVLRGAREALAAEAIGVVQFEYGGCYIDARVLLKDIWDLVSSTGAAYSFYKLYPEGLRHVPAYLQTLETFQYSNWAIVHRDWKKHIVELKDRA